MSFIEVRNLTKIYGDKLSMVTALDNVNFAIEEGELVVILGSSGAGKSTLLNLLGGMDFPTDGEYYFDKQDISKFNDKKMALFRRYDIGFVFQFYNLMPNLTALENIELAQSVSNNPFDANEIITSVGLEDRKKNFPSELSGGEQQRIAIARALVKNPKLLLCDEPTGALDSKTGKIVLEQIVKINKESKKTTIIVTHNASIAKIANRLITMKDGKILENKKVIPQGVEDLVW